MAEPGDLYECRIVTTRGNQTAINVRHYLCTAKAGTGVTDQTLATQLDATFQTALKALMDGGSQYRGVGVRRISPLPLGAEVVSTANAGNGNVAGDQLPAQICGMITLRSEFGGRDRRGRIYIPFVAEADNDTIGAPSTGYMTRLGSFAALLIFVQALGTAGNTNTFQPVVHSRKTGVNVYIRTATAIQKWATQRSRGHFGRPNPSPI